jgi:phosphate uptake regulator
MATDLERIGDLAVTFTKHVGRRADHIMNVAEMVIHLSRGQDVRHRKTG